MTKESEKYLSVLLFIVYFDIGYFTSKQAIWINDGMLVNGLLGLYDGTIGFKLSIILKANNGLDSKKSSGLLSGKTALAMATVGFVFAILAYQLNKVN